MIVFSNINPVKFNYSNNLKLVRFLHWVGGDICKDQFLQRIFKGKLSVTKI